MALVFYTHSITFKYFEKKITFRLVFLIYSF